MIRLSLWVPIFLQFVICLVIMESIQISYLISMFLVSTFLETVNTQYTSIIIGTVPVNIPYMTWMQGSVNTYICHLSPNQKDQWLKWCLKFRLWNRMCRNNFSYFINIISIYRHQEFVFANAFKFIKLWRHCNIVWLSEGPPELPFKLVKMMLANDCLSDRKM